MRLIRDGPARLRRHNKTRQDTESERFKSHDVNIHATVIYSITEGKYDLNRNLNFNDLKFDSLYNTYKYNGLPPKSISYVGPKTIDIIYENYKSDYLFYFYDKFFNKHIFSKSYEEHKKKLNEYRNKK